MQLQLDTKNPFGPKGKTPWITVDGQDVADSQLIIEYLGKYVVCLQMTND